MMKIVINKKCTQSCVTDVSDGEELFFSTFSFVDDDHFVFYVISSVRMNRTLKENMFIFFSIAMQT